MGGMVYHVLNRGNAGAVLFQEDSDYRAFEQVLIEAHQRVRMNTLAFSLMPNHWHLVLWPTGDRDLSEFMRWLTVTHTQRWHTYHETSGTGHLYQGRFKSFPIQTDDHLLTVCRYVERNPLRAKLVERAQDWRWSSLCVRHQGDDDLRALLCPWPVDPPADWVACVNCPQTARELEEVRCCVNRGRPFGSETWGQRIAKKLGLEHTFRPQGRPKIKIRKHVPQETITEG
jgi:putative transposase